MGDRVDKHVEEFLKWFAKVAASKPDLDTIFNLALSGVSRDELEKLYNAREIGAVQCLSIYGERRSLLEGSISAVEIEALVHECRNILKGIVEAIAHLHITGAPVPSMDDIKYLQQLAEKGLHPIFCTCARYRDRVKCTCLRDYTVDDLRKLPYGEQYLPMLEEDAEYTEVDNVPVLSEEGAEKITRWFMRDARKVVGDKVLEVEFRV